MSPGRIVLLNGTSSSGKSTIARELQAILAEPYLHLGIDTFIGMLPPRFFGAQPPADEGFFLHEHGDRVDITAGPVARRLLLGMYRCFAALASAGNNLIIDYVFLDAGGVADMVAVLAPFPAWFVGIHCPLAVALQRESR